MEIILIAAMTADRVIGRDNSIPWAIPGEQTRFKEVTMGHSLIMGRRTWQSIGHPLPGRRNIVLTGNNAFQAPSCEVVHSLQEGIVAAAAGESEKIFVIGGAQVYMLALEQADTLILTRIEQKIEGDTFFPEFSCPPFELVRTEEIREPVRYSILTYRRQGKNCAD